MKRMMKVKMIKQAVNRGLDASYMLMDGWHTCWEVIKSTQKIKREMLHIVNICKMNKCKFNIDGKELNSTIK